MKPDIFSNSVLVFLAVFLLPLTPNVFAQDKTLELAKSYEADGMYEKALSLYEKSYKADSNNLVILDRLKNIYKILGKNDSRLAIILRQVGSDSLNIVLLCELMDAYISFLIHVVLYSINPSLAFVSSAASLSPLWPLRSLR